jgi:hypothetical protein
MFFDHHIPFSASTFFRTSVTLCGLFLLSLPSPVHVEPRYLYTVQPVMTSPLSNSKQFVLVHKDMYFVLALFKVRQYLEYSYWSFLYIYNRSSFLWAISTYSTANCSVYIIVLSTYIILFPTLYHCIIYIISMYYFIISLYYLHYIIVLSTLYHCIIYIISMYYLHYHCIIYTISLYYLHYIPHHIIFPSQYLSLSLSTSQYSSQCTTSPPQSLRYLKTSQFNTI